MGNASKKLAAKCTLLKTEEQAPVAATFRSASKNSDRIREDDLIKFWGPLIDPRLAQYLTNFLFGTGANKEATCSFNRFAELYVFNARGTLDERMQVIYNCLGLPIGSEVPYQLLKECCESIASTYIKIVKTSSSKRAHKWIEKGFRGHASNVQALGEAVTATIGDTDNSPHQCTSDQVQRWLLSNSLLQLMSQIVFVNLYGVDQHGDDDERQEDQLATAIRHCLMPMPEGIDPMPDYPAFIDLAHIVWLNSNLPQKHQNKWRFLFSSHVHGESFSTLAGRIQEQGASILIIKDSNGYIFGGYAAEAWVLGPNFHGSDQSFLFSCAPRMRAYPATTFNNHYQYMNMQTKTLPNGIMMGGQFDFGGIWIKANPFGEGSSAESCTTYRGYKRLSKEPNFRFSSMEVWGVGDKPLSVKESDERDLSVLDRNPEAKAILDMAGRTRHSEGLREPAPL